MIKKMMDNNEVVKKIEIPRWPYADEKEETAVIEVLKSVNWWRNAGNKVKAFEKEFAEYHQCREGITVANGTIAIEIALKSLGIGENDEVILPAFTFYSTVSAVLAVKAIPVIVDVYPDTFCIDTEQVEKAVNSKTKAIIAVHMAGNIADMDNINNIAKKHNLYVIEDAAHAHGAEYKGKKAGSLGTCSTFSFQNAKLMTAGEGGIILSNDSELIHNALLQSNCGREEGDTTYQHVLVGTNARLSEVQGAILQAQLSRLDEQICLREKNYQHLSELLEEVPGIQLQKIDEHMTVNSHYMIMFYYDKKYFKDRTRDEFVKYLKELGIPANRSYESIHRLPIFKKLDKKAWRIIGVAGEDLEFHCTNSESISNEVVCLGHNILLGDNEIIESIVDIIRKFGI